MDNLSGEAALPSLLALREGSFEFLFDQNSPTVTLDGDPMGILMDACRHSDERK